MKHDYTALDSAIKAALAAGPKKFREMEIAPEIKRQAIKLAATHNAGVKNSFDKLQPWRFLVRRLDALDLQRIIHGGPVTGWSLLPE